MGRALSGEEFAALCHLLQNKGAANINIVTGTHAAPAIAGGLALARAGGLCLPVLWNTSGYESLSTLSLLDDVVDVFLPDLKTLSTGRARDFFGAADYPAIAAAAVQAMIDAKPLSFSQDGALIQGVLVRHLVLPGHLDETRTVLEWFARYAQGRALLSLMTQYTPLPNRQPETEKPASLPERFVNEAEYETLLRWLEELGIEDGYYQELEPGSAWLPDFSQAEPFPGGLGRCIWHWKTDGAVALV
jgi:putative pyruvate formate lyase activating enzyme